MTPGGGPPILDWEEVGGGEQVANEPQVGPSEMAGVLYGRLRLRDVVRIQVQLVLLGRSALTVGQYSAGIWTVVAWVVGFAASRGEAPKEFYSAGASAITTLLLALAITAAWFRLEPLPGPRAWIRDQSRGRDLFHHFKTLDPLEHRELADAIVAIADQYYGSWTRLASRWLFRLVYGVLLLLALLVGEMFALLALMQAHPDVDGDPRPVLAAVSAGLVGVGLVALLGKRDADK